MSEPFRHTPYHPRWYRKRMSVWWWLKKPSYTLFVAREMTSLPVAWFAALLLWQTWALGSEPGAYARFLAVMRHPAMIVANVLALGGVLFHAITWFNLAPKAMAVRLGGRRVPGTLIAAANYLLWAVLSLAVLLLLRRP